MNLTQARKIARRQLRFGRMRESATSSYVYCTRCKARITTAYPAWYDNHPRRIEDALERAIVEHLSGRYADCIEDECPADGCILADGHPGLHRSMP